MRRYTIALFIATLGLLGAVLLSSPVQAQSFNAGRIIEDSVFTNYNSMNTSQIQSFLNSKVSHCDTNGDRPSEYGGGTRRQYAASRGVSPPFTCLKDYHQNGKSAAQIIRDAAHEFRINPQVLIVLIQKEQGLVTDEWPWPVQYRAATGYGCPDTAPCDSEYYGLTNQVRWAARMFRAIMNNSPGWYTPYVLGNNQIPWHPDLSRCGYSTVNIQNRATQALYNYTPYRPNQAALNAGYGTGDSCSSYGNRNFFLYFRDWFGSGRTLFTSLETPRWMQTRSNVYKKDPSTGNNTGSEIQAGTQLRFVDKIRVNNVWYLRTEHDRNSNLFRGIRQQDLQEIPYELLENPRYMSLTKNARKVDPRSGRLYTSQVFSSGTNFKFTSKIFINGSWFYRTEYDTNHGINKAFYASSTGNVTFENFERPRFMQIRNTVQKINPITEAQSSQTFTAGSQHRFASKVNIGGQWFYRTEEDTHNNTALAVPASSTTEVPFSAVPDAPKWMRITQSTRKVNPVTGEDTGATIAQNTRLLISQSITVDGNTFFRTVSDSNTPLTRAFPASVIVDDEYSPISSTTMRLNANTRKQNPSTKQDIDQTLEQGRLLTFTSRISIDGEWYYRTEYDTQHNLDKVIKEDYLSNP